MMSASRGPRPNVSTIRRRGDPVLARVARAVPADVLSAPAALAVMPVTQWALSVGRQGPGGAGAESDVAHREVSFADAVADLHRVLMDFRDREGFGRAIAAPQAGYDVRVIAAFLDGTAHTLINPTIIRKSSRRRVLWDDCFSFPEDLVRVARHVTVTVRFHDTHGRQHEWKDVPWAVSELLQHEYDHLDGILAHDIVRPLTIQPTDASPRAEAARIVHRALQRERGGFPLVEGDTPPFIVVIGVISHRVRRQLPRECELLVGDELESPSHL